MIYALMLATSALSGDSAAATAVTQQQATPRSERRICRTVERAASRMGGDRVCKTAAQWEEERQAAERFVRDRQNQNLEVQTVNTPAAPQ